MKHRYWKKGTGKHNKKTLNNPKFSWFQRGLCWMGAQFGYAFLLAVSLCSHNLSFFSWKRKLAPNFMDSKERNVKKPKKEVKQKKGPVCL